MICPACGATLPPSAKFCNSCGARVNIIEVAKNEEIDISGNYHGVALSGPEADVLYDIEKRGIHLPMVPKGELHKFGFSVRYGHVSALSLNHLHLGSLPDSIGSLPALQDLYLIQNELASLPDSVGKLQSLISLDLNGNHLSDLPRSLENLPKLAHLFLPFNKFKTCPACIFNMKSLKELIFMFNGLTSLPSEIERLTNIEKLVLANNQIETLPEELGNFQSIRTLHLANNRLTSFPASITRLATLKVLSFGHNQLQSIPESIGDLRALEELTIENNHLTSIPDSIGELRGLKHLDLQGNPLTSLPFSMANLTSLKFLTIDKDRFNEFPEAIKIILKALESRGCKLGLISGGPGPQIVMRCPTPGQISSAEQDAKRVLTKNPTDTRPLINLANQKIMTRDVEGALAVIQQVIQIDPTNAVGWGNLGSYSIVKHDYDTAIEAKWKAYQLEPSTLNKGGYIAAVKLKIKNLLARSRLIPIQALRDMVKGDVTDFDKRFGAIVARANLSIKEGAVDIRETIEDYFLKFFTEEFCQTSPLEGTGTLSPAGNTPALDLSQPNWKIDEITGKSLLKKQFGIILSAWRGRESKANDDIHTMCDILQELFAPSGQNIGELEDAINALKIDSPQIHPALAILSGEKIITLRTIIKDLQGIMAMRIMGPGGKDLPNETLRRMNTDGLGPSPGNEDLAGWYILAYVHK